MSAKFGWCTGPVGATGDHASCRAEIGTGAGIARCSCPCHQPLQDNESETKKVSA